MRAFVCTVGQRDLTLDGETAEGHGKKMREFGADLRRRYQDVKGRLAAPIVDRALEYLREAGQSPDEVVLIVSDQPGEGRHRLGDTCEAGEVLKLYLEERRGVGKVWLRRIKDNPTDLDAVMSTVRGWLRQWGGGYVWIDLVLTGGTPAMTTGSLLAALDVCPDKITPLYVPQEGEVRPLDVVRRVRTAQQRRDLVIALRERRFGAALDLLEDGQATAQVQMQAVQALLSGADARLSFRLSEARQSLAKARGTPSLPDPVYRQIRGLLSRLPADEDGAGLLGELYHNACEKLSHEEYADFVLRLFNFQQAALRQATERAGVVFERGGELLEAAWVAAEPGFANFAGGWRQPHTGASVELEDRRVSGPVLLCLAAYLAQEGKLPAQVWEAAERLQPLAQLRNKCFAAHDFKPVGQPELESRFCGTLQEILDTMATLYRAATGRQLGPDPFAETVELCETLLRGVE